MQVWDELLRQSLLGSARANEDLPTLPEPLAALLTGCDASPEEQLLNAVTLVDRYRRLGALPAEVSAEPPVAPAETLPVCAEPLAKLLYGLLEDDDPRLLRELLVGMAAIPCLAPPDTLPALLDLAGNRELMMPMLRVVGGERLRWLAAHHPQWSALLGGQPGDDAWLSGNITSRSRFLREERQRDATAARERLAEGFAQESARDRQALLECLEEGLNRADIPFLEGCLADRSQAVRLRASQFLIRLGDNVTATLVRDSVAGMIATEGMLGRRLQVALPQSFDKDWARLGLRDKPPAGERIGQRAFWMVQWLGLLGPSRLAALLQVDLDTLSGLIKRSDFARELKDALAEGAVALQDADYAEWRLNGVGVKDFPHTFASLSMSLSAQRREALLEAFLQTHLAQLKLDALHSLLNSVGGLSPAATRVLAAGFDGLCERLAKHPWSSRSLADLAYYLAPTEAELLKVHCQNHSGLNGVNEFWRRYERRCRIHQMLQSGQQR